MGNSLKGLDKGLGNTFQGVGDTFQGVGDTLKLLPYVLAGVGSCVGLGVILYATNSTSPIVIEANR